MRTNLIISIVLALFLISVSTGCDSKKQDKKPTPQQLAAKVEPSKAEVPKEPAAKPDEGYSYDPHGRRDPFKSLIIAEKGKIRPDELPPLQRVDSADLRLTGIIWDKSGYYLAILETPDAKGFVVKEGTIVGLNKGVIKKITNRSLIIEEKIKTYLGELKIREVPLELHKREEGR